MPERKKKLDVFAETINRASQKEIQAINAELKKKWDAELERADARLKDEIEKHINERKIAISTRERLRISNQAIENKRALLEFREECAQEVFRMARKKIRAFTASDAYGPHLCGLLQKACEVSGGAKGEAFLRAEDMGLADRLAAAVPGVKLTFKEGAFVLGGLQVNFPDKHRRVDMSFDSAIVDLVGHFSELSSMSLEEA